jgi:hypothetical protein
VDTTDHKLRIRFEFTVPPDFPFPVVDSTNDTLTSTAFRFSFFSNGKPITLDRAVVFPSDNEKYSGYYSWGKEIDSVLSFSSDTGSLKKLYTYQAVIPFYAFQHLKAGKQKIEVKISQTRFCSEYDQSVMRWNETFHDTSWYYYKNYADRPLISGTISFSIKVPPIYQTMLYGEGLMLRNDSVFTPAGMDNTIWNSSYPDIYWVVYSPGEMYYCRTDFERTTDTYTGQDTFALYHYCPNDSIGIGVYDHDWLSRDDWMGDWEGPLNEIRGDNTQALRFDYIQWFCINAKTTGVINK